MQKKKKVSNGSLAWGQSSAFQVRIGNKLLVPEDYIFGSVINDAFGNPETISAASGNFGETNEHWSLHFKMDINQAGGTIFNFEDPPAEPRIDYWTDANQYVLSNGTINIVEHDTAANFLLVTFSGSLVGYDNETLSASSGLLRVHYDD